VSDSFGIINDIKRAADTMPRLPRSYSCAGHPQGTETWHSIVLLVEPMPGKLPGRRRPPRTRDPERTIAVLVGTATRLDAENPDQRMKGVVIAEPLARVIEGQQRIAPTGMPRMSLDPGVEMANGSSLDFVRLTKYLGVRALITKEMTDGEG
jgi:hypothetical protein